MNCTKLWKLSLALGLGSLTSCTTALRQLAQTTPAVEAIAEVSGTNQSHAVEGTFGQALVAAVSMDGVPMSGIVVTFSAPLLGPSATFSNTTSRTATATTDMNGIATSPSFTANGKVGAYTITATADGASTPAGFILTNTTGAPASIVPASGSAQSASINSAFGAPLVAQVLDVGQNPVSGAIVTFTAPASGASGTFANGTATETQTTGANGLATSTTFTANGTEGADVVTATVAGVANPANFALTNAAGAPTTIIASQGTPQSASINTAFSVPLAASVLDAHSNPVSGVPVTFTAPTSGASGTFVGGQSVVTTVTNATGIATAPTFSANGTVGSYSVTATASSLSATATFSLANRQAGNTYVFYLSGQDAAGLDFYALAGSVVIAPNGNVLSGEQDYDAPETGVLSPQPSGDTITGGTLSVNANTGQGTLKLTTNNTSVGVNGVETLGVQFVNTNHAQVIQFDGSATSSGGMDLQTQGALKGGFSFALTGMDNIQGPVVFGGVFTISGTTLQSGTVDQNDDGTLGPQGSFSGTISAPDSLGRGTFTTSLNYLTEPLPTPIALNYYLVGPEVIRIVGVDPGDTELGSAFGQGSSAGSFGDSSIVNSVFAIQGSADQVNYGTVGALIPSSGNFTGVADDSELFVYDTQAPETPIAGTYTIASDGYGSLTIPPGTLGDVSTLGIYMTDPKLNLNDPNNTSLGVGGALLIDMDSALPGGIGVVIPQTDTSTGALTGNYSFGAQAFYTSEEFDFVAQGSVSAGTLNGTGLLSDIFKVFGQTTTDSGVTFSGTPLPDTVNPGRYTLFSSNPSPNPLNMTVNGTTTPFDVVLYQASGGQIFWLDEDPTFTTVFVGSMQQQGSLAGIPGAGSSSSVTISATSGTPQSANVNTAFALPLSATVSTAGVPTGGVVVTFTAPSSGASGTFAGGSTTATATTNASGIATSPTFTANASAGSYTVTASAPGATVPANFSLTNSTVAQEIITATSGTSQSATVNTAFAAPLVATVTTGGSPTSGVVVTFTAPSSGASGTFAGGSTTATATTNASGVATSPTITANGTTGSYTVAATVAGVATPANFSLTNTAAVVTITATTGTPQTTTVNVAFPLPLSATVTTNGNPSSGLVVTFTAPSSGASGTFAGGTTTATATTNASGVATSPTLTANGTTGNFTVMATVAGAPSPANFSLTNAAAGVEVINATSGTPQTAAINNAFASPFVATVTTNGSPNSGVVVTFTAPSSGASGTFTGGTTTTTATTNASGVATSPTFTANGSVGSYAVTATVTGVTTPVDFSLTNNFGPNTTTYVFSLSGLDTLGPNFYALVGAVTLNSSGSVLGGEQDYNAAPDGEMSPEPSGDTITGGTLTVSSTTGQGTLTLNTNNTNLGVSGVETLGVQFVNSNHALVIEFDGVATSSGTMDLQTLPTALSGGYAFIMDGVDTGDNPVNYGGVFSISSGTTLQNGLVDTNDFGTVTTGTALSGTVSAFDFFGRGTVTSSLNYSGSPITLNYYVVGPEAVRLTDVDTTDSAIGSAFGQGSNATGASNSMLGTSVFALNGSPYPANYAAVGMFSTSNTTSQTADFAGVGDDNELVSGIELAASAISGTYSIATNGYGNLTITNSGLGDVSLLGLYMTDPNLNLMDPNNTTSGLGGGIVSDMDSILVGGTGFVLPQTNTSTSSFTGEYGLGAQGFFNSLFEFDIVAQGSVSSGTLSATALISDPFSFLGSDATDTGATMSGTPLADTSNPGRYTLFSTNTKPNPLKIKVGTTATPLNVVLYQASGGFLFWLDEDVADIFAGSLQQLGSLSGIP